MSVSRSESEVQLYELELLVKAASWDRAKTVLKYHLDIDEKQRTNMREIDELFMVAVRLPEEKLTTEFYGKIFASDELAIVADELSRKNARLIDEQIYKVEMQLRRLLLHVCDLVEAFNEIIAKNTQYTKNFQKEGQIISTNAFEPITSHMTLGEMVNILSFDLSWDKRALTVNEFTSLLNDVTDIKSLATKLGAKIKKNTIWDLINKHLLESKVAWGDISKAMTQIKRARDNVAHFLIITSEEANEVLKQSTHILGRIEKEKKLTSKQAQDFKGDTEVFATTLRSLPLESFTGIISTVNMLPKLNSGLVDSIMDAQRQLNLTLTTPRGLYGAIMNAGGMAQASFDGFKARSSFVPISDSKNTKDS